MRRHKSLTRWILLPSRLPWPGSRARISAGKQHLSWQAASHLASSIPQETSRNSISQEAIISISYWVWVWVCALGSFGRLRGYLRDGFACVLGVLGASWRVLGGLAPETLFVIFPKLAPKTAQGRFLIKFTSNLDRFLIRFGSMFD